MGKQITDSLKKQQFPNHDLEIVAFSAKQILNCERLILMIYTEMTKKAMKISYQAHKDQVDKSGIPYIFHPIHLAEQMETEEAVIVALLHDVVEDTEWSINALEQEGFSKDIINALVLLTHHNEIEYLDYIRKIKHSSNQYAKIVKIADLKHNSDISRFDNIDEEISKRIEKYTKAITILSV